jgi:hypothetical protein
MGLLFVVAREEEHLYDSLVQAFAGRPGVRVVLDRRGGERREASAEPGRERRERDRRIRPHASGELTTVGWTVVRVNRLPVGV